MSRSCLIITTMIALGQSCATSGSQSESFAAEPEVVAGQMHVVAVAPTAVSAGVSVPDTTLERIDSLLVNALRDGGVQVVAPATYEVLWAEVYEHAEPIFDQHTGQRDEAAYQAAWSAFYEKLGSRYQATVVLFPEIWEVGAEVQDGYARWDGASENMASTGTQILAIMDVLFGNDDDMEYDILPSGYVEALSLSVVLEDSGGATLYSRQAGIERLRQRIASDRLADAETLRNWAKIEDAVRRALDPILDAYREATTLVNSTDKTIATQKR